MISGDDLLTFIPHIIVGVTSALFASWLALRKHRSQEWWALRVEGYTSLIAALSELVIEAEFRRKLELEQRADFRTEESQREAENRRRASQLKVDCTTKAGSFLLSSRARSALDELEEIQSGYHDSHFEHLDQEISALKTCLEAIASAARTDLGVRS